MSVLAIPLAGIRVVDVENPETGRNYDYAPGAGARVAYSWYSRKTSYPGFFEARQRQAEWRAFGNVTVVFR